MTALTVRLPNSVHQKVKELALRDEISVNQFIALALAEKVGSMGAAEFFAERGKNGDVDWAIAFLEGRPE